MLVILQPGISAVTVRWCDKNGLFCALLFCFLEETWGLGVQPKGEILPRFGPANHSSASARAVLSYLVAFFLTFLSLTALFQLSLPYQLV